MAEREKGGGEAMRETGNDYFWIYIVVSVIFFGVSVYFMPKIISFLDKTIENAAARKKKKPEMGGKSDER